jgi:hypothetical protein
MIRCTNKTEVLAGMQDMAYSKSIHQPSPERASHRSTKAV